MSTCSFKFGEIRGREIRGGDLGTDGAGPHSYLDLCGDNWGHFRLSPISDPVPDFQRAMELSICIGL